MTEFIEAPIVVAKDAIEATCSIMNAKDANLLRGIDSGKKKGFFFKTSDVAAVCDLMYGFRDLVNEVCLVVTKQGIKIGESACADNLFLFANFPSKHFTHFCCNPHTKEGSDGKKKGEGGWEDEEDEDKIVIALEPRKVHSLLGNNQQRDTMVWLYDENKPDNLTILRYPHENGSSENRYELKLLHLTETGFRAPRETIDYMLVLNSATMTKIVNGLTSFSHEFDNDWVTIECSQDKVQFSMTNGCLISHAIFTLITKSGESEPVKFKRSRTKDVQNTSDDDFEIGVEEPVISRKYRLVHLNQLLKCFSITRNGILLYIFKDYPIIFEIKIGGLGELRAALLFKAEDEEGGDDGDKMEN